MARAEDRKTKQSHPKKEGGSQEGRGGDQQKDWLCTCYKKLQHLRKLCFAIAARPITLRGQGAAWRTQQRIQKYGYSNRN